ncbi:FtsW/RodA/SpoVE family cell cycle protein [Ruminococcaceae bacterium OttesenSCG-928-I18]|nr:FtsW/RodA/SpoVE family cell cycle protein [Ruminococcaceae bacterium OttesenSCG-928-I18]
MAVPKLPDRPAQDTAGLRVVSSKENAPASKKKKGPLLPGKLGRVDIPFLTLVLMLLLFGLVMLFSASYPTGHMRFGDSYAFIMPQLRYAALGLVILVGATLVDYHLLRKFAWPLMFLTYVLLVVVLFMEPKNGAKRWIWLNAAHTQSIQPSELVKFAVILLFAALIAANQKRIKSFTYGFLPFVVILGSVAGLLLLEPHLSCTILIMGIGVTMMFAGGTSLRWFGFAAILGAGALYLLLTKMPDLVPYAMSRITTWLDPFNAPDEKAHQTIQSLIAVGSGGLTGNGIGGSVQKFLYLPEMYNDYIFAIICEELGFVGAICMIVLFLLLLLRGLHIALRAKDKFGAMICVGVSVQIALQTFLHIAVNTNAIPSTGISLPFFSSGGTSLVMLMGQVGVMLSVSRQGYASVAEARQKAAEEAQQEAAGQPKAEEELPVAEEA